MVTAKHGADIRIISVWKVRLPPLNTGSPTILSSGRAQVMLSVELKPMALEKMDCAVWLFRVLLNGVADEP